MSEDYSLLREIRDDLKDMRKDMGLMAIDVAITKTATADLPTMKTDIEGLKRFRGWILGLIGVSAAGGTGVAGILKMFSGAAPSQ